MLQAVSAEERFCSTVALETFLSSIAVENLQMSFLNHKCEGIVNLDVRNTKKSSVVWPLTL